MKKLYAQTIAASLLIAAATTPQTATAQTETRTATVEVYGDPMMGGTELSSTTVSYYGPQNLLLRQAAYDKDGNLTTYSTYEYNTAGQLTLTFSRTWGLLNNGLYGFSTPNDSTTYGYNAQGLLEVEQQPYNTYKYEYDDEGNLTKKTQYYKNTYTGELSEQNTTTYANYEAPGCPTSLVYEDLMYGDSYEGTLSYTADGKILAELDSVYDTDAATKVFKQSKHYTYDAQGQLATVVGHQRTTVYDYNTWEITGYEVVATDSLVYIADGEGRVKEETYYYDSYNKAWSKNATYNVTETRTFDPSTAASITVGNVITRINTNRISLKTIPDQTGVSVYDLYRDGVKIHRFDSSNWSQAYSDEGLFNGKHEYFVQTVWTAATSGTETGKNISAIVATECNYPLPAPTNVHGVSQDDNYMTEYGYTTSVMTIAWDAPAYTDDMKFKGYNIMEASSWGDSFYNSVNPQQQETTYTFDMYNYYTEKENIYIQAVYEYGVANSDTVTISMADLPIATDINDVKGSVAFGGYHDGEISLTQAANIRVYDASGKIVGEAKNATSLSIANETRGRIYLVAIERDGKLEVLKVQR